MEQNKKHISPKRVLAAVGIALLVLVLATAIAIWSIWVHELRTLTSFHKIADRNDEHQDGSVYEMTVSGGYYFDEFLAQGGVSTDAELIAFITGNLTKGVVDVGINPPDVACSSFTATLDNGHRVFGRNYDYSKTNTCIVYTNPGNGRYASVSTVDLQFLGLSVDEDITGLMDKITCLAAPYIPFDGMNEAGVSCAIYMTYQGPGDSVSTDQNTDKPDITSTTMLRLILDCAGSVEEAAELVSSYDLHDSATSSYHYMVADSTGRSAILEWVGDKDATDTNGTARQLKVTYNDQDSLAVSPDWQTVTNFIVAPGYYDNEADMKGLDRYQHIQKELADANGVLPDVESAMDVLAQVGRRTWNNDDSNSCTVHSVVYDLTEKTALWIPNEHYGETGYEFKLNIKK